MACSRLARSLTLLILPFALQAQVPMDKLSIAAGILFVCVGLYIAISFIHSRSALQHPPPQPAPGAQAKP